MLSPWQGLALGLVLSLPILLKVLAIARQNTPGPPQVREPIQTKTRRLPKAIEQSHWFQITYTFFIKKSQKNIPS